MDSLEGYVSDDELAIPALNELGWDVSTVSWRDDSVDWDDFEVTVIRTTWDYQRYPDEFIAVLADIEGSRSRLENSLQTVKWNLDKGYLQELETNGLPTVPTLWDAEYREDQFHVWLDNLQCDELIIKPTVSATAEHTYRLKEYDPKLQPVFDQRPFMVQPFMPAIVNEGEYSLFYFDDQFSHAILKTPKAADFRVQEEHGGIITSISVTPDLLHAGRLAVSQIDPIPLYARVDLVRNSDNQWLIMELELIEPALYFRTDPGSPKRFADALVRRVDKSKWKSLKK